MASDQAINKAREAILQALSDLHSVGNTSPDIKLVATTADYKAPDGKAFRTAIKRLVDSGFITKTKGEVTLTAKGLESLPAARPPPSAEEQQAKLIEMILKNPKELPGGLPDVEKTTLVFKTMLDGKSHTKVELANVAGYSRTDTKKFRNLVKRFAQVKVIDDSAGSEIQFNDSVFPFGRPGGDIATDDDDDGNSKRKATNVESKADDTDDAKTTKKRSKTSESPKTDTKKAKKDTKKTGTGCKKSNSQKAVEGLSDFQAEEDRST